MQSNHPCLPGNGDPFMERWLILDMCAGRGIKTGQIATLLPHAKIEA